MFTNYLVEKMIDKNIVLKEERDLYLYGLTEGGTILNNILITMIIGVVFGNIINTSFFLISYIPLRSFAGGYHASSPKRCFIYSLFLIGLIEVYFSYIHESFHTYMLILGGIALWVIYKKSPVQSPNKPLSELEIHNYKKIVNILIGIEIIFVLLVEMLGLFAISSGIMVALIVEAILLEIAKV
jgi:accessory gene regulator B